MPNLSKSTLDKTFRLFLRLLPGIPGPELFDLFKDLNESKRSINKKIEETYKALKNTTIIIDELQNELNERTEKLKILQTKYDEYSKLAEIEEEKVKPILKEIENTLGKNQTKERFISFIINIIAGIIIFLLGVWIGPKITTLLNISD